MDKLAFVALCTDTQLCGDHIIERYASRWKVESCFHELKNLFGFKDTWQQTRQVAARWRCIVTLAYSLPRLMAHVFGEKLGSALLHTLAERSPHDGRLDGQGAWWNISQLWGPRVLGPKVAKMSLPRGAVGAEVGQSSLIFCPESSFCNHFQPLQISGRG